MTQGLVLPRFGRSTISDLLPAVAAHLGHSEAPILGLPQSRRWVVLLVDGLGWYNLRGATQHAPFLSALASTAETLTAGIPSTTVTSLTSLGTGTNPGRHGMVGFSSRMPHTRERFHPLVWDCDVEPEEYQSIPTWFERLHGAGVAVTTVSLERFAGSGLTRAALRGGEFSGLVDEDDEDDRIRRVLEAATRSTDTLVYTYERHLDHTGHTVGCGSAEWRSELLRIDSMVERLREELPDDVRLVITGDHGMVDVPEENRLIVDHELDLMAGTAMVAGEARFRQVYAGDDLPDTIAARWRDRLGATAWVRTREEAIDEGWLGPVSDQIAPRFGDVLVAMRDRHAIMNLADPGELSLVGMHGSLTAEEMTVPLLVA